ncbi:MAG TPA: magnesium transporter [Caulobacteraceae bacterium]|jgi:magnesium transporter|nr:magnesium transporter [Caulobacteraceae bacterium]
MSKNPDNPADLELKDPPAAQDLEDLALGEDYALNPEFVEMVVDAADRGDTGRLRELVGALHPADVADLMGFLSADYREEIIPLLAPEALAEILSELETNLREEVLEIVSPATLAKALEDLDSDDAADVVDDLEDDKRAQVLAALPEVDRAAIETTLAYEDESAGRLMQREVLAAPQFWTVGQTIDHIRREGDDLPELFFDIYVVDPAFRPVGAAPVSRLLRSKRETLLSEIMEPVTEIPVDMDQEEVAYIFDKYHLISAPVVEPGGRLVGQITVDDVVGVIQEESEEDMLALAGVSDAGRDATMFGIVRSRILWLVLNLATEAVAVSAIAIFQNEIAKLVALAVLMPIVSSVGGNAGTQTLAVAVRALAGRELNAANAARIIWRELGAGIINGVIVAVAMGAAVVVFYHNWRLALVVGLALVANIFIAAVGGILVPLALERMGRDPAVSSSIFITFLTDFMGFLAVLAIAALILL